MRAPMVMKSLADLAKTDESVPHQPMLLLHTGEYEVTGLGNSPAASSCSMFHSGAASFVQVQKIHPAPSSYA